MRLVPLSRADDYDFPADTFDVRGWEVRTTVDRENVGKVDDILVDDAGRPRYLDVDLGVFKKHVLLPLQQARVDSRDDVVWVDGLAQDQFEQIPEYTQDPRVVTEDYEVRLDEMYHDAATTRGLTRPDDETRSHAGRRRLVRLGDLDDFRVAKGDVDPRGWDVLTSDGKRVGEVSELIVDIATMEARYLDADVDEKKLDLERIDRHILVPVESARLDRDKKKVLVDGLFSTDLTRVPVYSGLPLTDDDEQEIRSAYRVESPTERGGARPGSVRDATTQPTARVSDRGELGTRDRDDSWRDVDRFYGARRGRGRDVIGDRAHDDDADRVDDRGQAQREAVLREGESATVRSGEQEVRIRLSGDDIVIEKRPRD